MAHGSMADSRFWKKGRGYDEAVDAVMQGTPLQRVAQEFLASGSPTAAA